MGTKTILFTGAGGFIGKRILRHYLDEQDTELYLLEHGPFLEKLERHIEEQLPEPDARQRVHIFKGDITQPGLGLEAELADTLKTKVTRAIHLAAIYDLSVPKEIAHRINVDGTQNVLDFLEECTALERLAYASTVAISGWHKGPFTEDDFDVGQTFKNHYDETKYLAEKLVRERRDRIPTTICRPTVVVGDSRTGAMEKIDGPYLAVTMVARNMHLAVVNGGATKNHMVPVDYVAKAFYTLAEDSSCVGGVFHLGDPNPLTYNAFFDLICDRWGKIKPLLKLPPFMVRPIFYLPLVPQIMGVTWESFHYSYLPVDYGFENVQAALKPHGISCPPVAGYIEPMLEYYRRHHRDPHVRKKIWRESV